MMKTNRWTRWREKCLKGLMPINNPEQVRLTQSNVPLKIQFIKSHFHWDGSANWLPAIPGVSKDKGEVYYITPMGKKIHTKTELQMHLTSELQLENFTFIREPIGMSTDEEMIRVAKPTARTAPTEMTLGKRVSKPKAPKDASSPPQGWTPAKAVKSTTMSSPRPIHSTRASEEIESKTQTTPKSSKSNKQKKGEPCSIECVLAMGRIPQLQCINCLCLYHHECIASDTCAGNSENKASSRNISVGLGRNDTGYICEYCKKKSTSPQSKSSQNSPPKSNPNASGTPTKRESDPSKDSNKTQTSVSLIANKNS